MSEVQDIQSPTTRERLEKLWLSLLGVFESELQSEKPQSTEMLNCGRLFLKDQNVKAPKDQQERLQELHMKLTSRLIAVMDSPTVPSSTALETIRRFLHDNHIEKAADLKGSLEQLQNQDLPFTQ
jgi:hypothetical protein